MSANLDRLKAALSDRYTIEREIGRGGMATVYLAHDLKLQRKVAVKVLRPELAAIVGTERFLQEIRLTSNLQHPNIIAVHDAGEADGLLFYTMQYVDEQSLQDRLSVESQLSLEEVQRIAGDVASALDYAHRQGIIHRDIKPANIMLQGGRALVADFGIALALSTAAADRLTETGLSLGTPEYMSPEQASADRANIDARTDVYSLGAVVYQMLTGEPPHTGRTAQAVIAKLMAERPLSPRTVRETVPVATEHAVMKALAKVPADRFATAIQFAEAVTASDEAAGTSTNVDTAARRSWGARLRKPRVVVLSLVTAAVLITTAVWVYQRSAGLRWARNTALPEVATLVEEGRTVEAFRLAQQAEQHIPGDPQLARLMAVSSYPFSVSTAPSGADVYYRAYGLADDEAYLGRTPIDSALVPAAVLRWRVVKQGFEPIEGTVVPQLTDVLRIALDSIGTTPPGMVHVGITTHGGAFDPHVMSTALLFSVRTPADSEPVAIAPYWIDRYEVTNEAFQVFVDSGGYRERKYWRHPFRDSTGELSWDEAAERLVDATGRPGPTVWNLSTYPAGEAQHPVGGVSWYEAAAYCEFVAKRLPTIYHWFRAAGSAQDPMVALSNFGGSGAAAVGSHDAVSTHGVYDMAGNVTEWVSNEAGEDRLFLGGAWNEPDYTFTQVSAQSPFDRDEQNGFRCAKFSEALSERLTSPVQLSTFPDPPDPVSDEVFQAYASSYTYDDTPLRARIDTEDDSSPHWRKQTISFDAAYDNDRVIAHLYLPKNVTPPYQVVLYGPSPSGLRMRSSENLAEMQLLDFLRRSGRAFVFPIYQGSFERFAAFPTLRTAAWRDRVIRWVKDLRRTIDYLETRDDIETGRLAYVGWSLGAVHGPIFTALEPRFRASVLISGGLYPFRMEPEIEPVNFAPRSRVPMLMINGRKDSLFPIRVSQIPLYQLIGAVDKERAMLEGGHIPQWNEVINHTLTWLDRQLGRVDEREQ